MSPRCEEEVESLDHDDDIALDCDREDGHSGPHYDRTLHVNWGKPVTICADCQRVIGCNSDCGDMDCEHCLCYHGEGRD